MCGIFGGVRTEFTEQALTALAHRGPDQSNLTHVNADTGAPIVLGQTRLNVVDREDVALPVSRNGATILFNGEVYNYIELREELVTRGWTFSTKTDTEVVLVAYLEWGEECLQRFNGMFALAIWDGKHFFCARDRLGQKPLFYRCYRGRFEFASEAKVLAGLEFVRDEVFDLFEFCFDGRTIYKDTFSVPPAHYLRYDVAGGDLRIRQYWDIPHRVEGRLSDEREAIDRFIGLLTDAVRLRLRADVPIGIFLSGGLDSSLLAALAGVDTAFICQFDEYKDSINEEYYATDLTARLDIDATVIRPNRSEFLADLSTLAYHLEMPTGSFSVFPLFRLARECREQGYKVVLSGEGSDELFNGYVRNEVLAAGVEPRVSGARARQYAAMLERFTGDDLDRFCRMASRAGLVGAAQMRALLANRWDPRRTFLENIAYVETRVFLQALLQMGDRMTMAHSVEARCPFLDYRLVEFAFSLDDSLRFRDGNGKWIVQAAAQEVLPPGAKVLQREVKHGLPTPVNQWLHGQPGFDRRYWNSLLTAECIKALCKQ